MRFKQACNYIGVGRTTMYKLIEQDHIQPFRTPGGHYVFDSEMLDAYLGKTSIAELKKTVCYSRVSTSKRKDDLKRQVQVCELFCAQNGWSYEVIEDIGSGMNFKKPGLAKTIQQLVFGKVQRVVVTHKDRLLRFGTELIEQICQQTGAKLVCINKSEERNAQKELAEDIISIITVFSGRMYGKRSRRNKKIIEENKKLFASDPGNENQAYDQDKKQDAVSS